MKPGDLARINTHEGWAHLHGKICILIDVPPHARNLPPEDRFWRVLNEGDRGISNIWQGFLEVISETG
jgi:hypothetical protein